MILNSHKLSRTFVLIAWVILGIYCFIAFLPTPLGIGIGLDPSWQYALSRVVQDKLIFGQDIIFTYGPLGYLIDGAVWNENFFSIFAFRFVVHGILFIVAFVKISNLKTNVQKISLFLSLLIPYLTNLSIDYKILFSFIILLSLESILPSKQTKWWFLGLGAVSGFCLLTKFSLGICILGSLVLFGLGNLYYSIKQKVNIFDSFFSLANSLFSAITVAFIFLNPNRSLSIKQVVSCLIIAVILGGTTWLFQKLYKYKIFKGNKVVRPALKTQNLKWHFISWCISYVAYCICLFLIIFNTSPSLINYLKTSLDLSSGYSSAMSVVGSPWELGFAISEIILIIILLKKLTSENLVNLGFSLGLAFVLWVTFKHGFVRQDSGHVIKFIFSTPLIVSLCIAKSKKISNLKFSFLIHIYVLVIALAYCLLPNGFGSNMTEFSKFQNLNYPSVVSKASTLLNFQKTSDTLDANNKVNLSSIKLPSEVTNLLKDKEVDVVPWEISIVAANKLNWKPRPIFQSYAAFTSLLDRKNSESILKEPRKYLIYHFSAIDSRHPFFDEPETFFNIFCNYQLSSDIPYLIDMHSLLNLMILEKRKSTMCLRGNVNQKSAMLWNKAQNVKVSDGLVVRAAVNIEYSGLGKIYKALFRSPPVTMNVNYINGSTGKYRIIPENANNGVIISHLPQNDSQALSFLQGQFNNYVKSFSFSTSNALLYKPNINVVLTSYKVLKPKAKKQPSFIDVSQLRSIRFIPTQLEQYMGVMDSKQDKDKTFKRGDIISVFGWATRKSGVGEKCWVLLTYDSNNTPLVITETNAPRPDVAKFFNKTEYMNSGWSVNVNSEVIPEGVHDIKAWIYEPDNNSAISLTGIYTIAIQ